MNGRRRFLQACRCEPVDHPPVWVMRQAGRHLPEYRELRERYSFHELVKTPDLACEVTLQPVRRYDMDAAITFSDILVIPEAMGQAYDFRGQGGIQMAFRIDSEDQIDRLQPEAVEERLQYVADAQRQIRAEVGDEKAVLGFGGSPWTLATYMVEGGSSRDYRLTKRLYFERRDLFDRLMNKIVDATVRYFRMQIAAGVDAIQIFDSWGGVLAPHDFVEASTNWIAAIVRELPGVPVIVFCKGAMLHAAEIAATGATVVGVDWTADLARVRHEVGLAVQGNLDPIVLETTPAITRRETRRVLDSMAGVNGHVFNLGHGISPEGRIDCMEAMVDEVRSAPRR